MGSIAGIFKNVAASDEVPRPVESVDVTKLELSAEEGFVYSRVDGVTPVKALMALTGFPDHVVAKALRRLIEVGAVAIGDNKDGGRSASKGKGGKADDPWDGMIFSLVELGEEVDLKDEQKKRILFVEAKIEDWNHFELLGLGRDSTDADVRKAYFKASKEFHPDAYFRRNLGSYGQRIDKIFKRMKLAYDVLANAKTREEYEENIVWPLTPEEEESLMQVALKKERENKRKELVKSRRLKRNPMIGRIKRAADLYQLGLEAMREDKWVEAASHLRMAASYDTKNQDYQRAHAEAAVQANHIRGINLLKNVEVAVESGVTADALEQIEQAITIGEEDAQVLANAAHLLLALDQNRKAFDVAQRATSISPGSRHGLIALAKAAERSEKWNVAFRAVEKLLNIDPKNSELKDWFKRLKRKI